MGHGVSPVLTPLPLLDNVTKYTHYRPYLRVLS